MKKDKSKLLLVEIVMILTALLVIYPIILMVIISLKSEAEVVTSPLSLPTTFLVENYKRAFMDMDYLLALKNTVIITFFSIGIGAMIYAMAAYAFMRAKKMKKLFHFLYLFIIAGQVLPPYTALVPLVVWLKKLHLVNSYQGIISVFIGAFATYSIFLISRFVNTIPISLEESAHIDGATPVGIFFRIILPLLKPIIITVVIVKAVDCWNHFLFPLVLLQGNKYRTLPLAVFFFKGEYITEWSILFAALTLSIIPIIIFYFMMQKHIIAGLTAGAVKS